MMKVKKRNSLIVKFEEEKIIRAVLNAMVELNQGKIDLQFAKEVAEKCKINFVKEEVVCIEDIQDFVQKELVLYNADLGIIYINYRNYKANERSAKSREQGLLSDEFISKYKHVANPINPLGSFVYYRTYSRWIPKLNRREYWWETVRRAVEYNCSLVPSTTIKEAEELYDNIFTLKQFLSGRTFWIGGTETSKHYPISNYNCAGIVMDRIEAFKELFYVLMVGTGVGFRVLQEDVEKLPPIRKGIQILNEDYNAIPKGSREESTSLEFNGDIAKIIIGDSKEAWCQALDFYLKILSSKEYRLIKTIIFNYDNVRPLGERLVKFGGFASGHESIKDMFIKINKTVTNRSQFSRDEYFKLEPIDCMDICNLIGHNVVVGGVRRTAEIALFDADNTAIIQAKNGLYIQKGSNWIENKDISHRKMSNNSIMYFEKPTRDYLHWHIEQMRYSGEPAFYVAENAKKRRGDFQIPNPCGEILLVSEELCNLTTVNVLAFVENGILDKKALLKAQGLSARAGYRMTCVTLELNNWDINQKRDRLIGCSLTGWQDMINATNMNREDEIKLLQELRIVVHQESEALAKSLNQNKPLLATTIKPEGTLSLLPTVSSGLHYSHSDYYIRRIRINNTDPLLKVMEELEYPIFPDNGEAGKTTSVIEFPVKSPKGKTKYEVTAIAQLENYKMFQEHYTDHNSSITVSVREQEWEGVEQWLWDNWECVIGISFLSLDDSYYPLLPYEAITEEEYNKRVSVMTPFKASLLQKYEKVEETLDVGSDEECSSGSCPIR